MSAILVFADESGDFGFRLRQSGSRYFILTTVTVSSYALGDALLHLRRRLAYAGHPVQDGFHASEDRQEVRNRVFELLAEYDFRVDATLLDKWKTYPKLQADEDRFYKTAWYYHMKHVAPRIACHDDDLSVIASVIAATLGTRKRQELLRGEISDVIEQVSPAMTSRVMVHSAASEPCLQAADYCSWAIQKKWERDDTRSYDIIADRVASEYDLFARSRLTAA